MDFGSIIALFRTGKFGKDFFSSFLEKHKIKKITKKNERIIRGRLELILNNHKPELELISRGLIDEAKKEILALDESKEKDFMISKINEVESGSVVDNLENQLEALGNIEGFQVMWKLFFYTKDVKELEECVKENSEKFAELYFREVQNYFSSNQKVDLGLLKNEKKELLSLLNTAIYAFQELMLKQIQFIVKEGIRNYMKPDTSLTEDKVTKMVKNVEKLARDIENGKINKYYDKLLAVVDSMLSDIISKINKD